MPKLKSFIDIQAKQEFYQKPKKFANIFSLLEFQLIPIMVNELVNVNQIVYEGQTQINIFTSAKEVKLLFFFAE